MHIVIVGGGTAGWLTAAIALVTRPQHTYTVIESTALGIIGVGESTTGFFTGVITHDLQKLGINHDDFIIKTGATCKLGIRHKSWTPDQNQSYFGPLDGSYSQFESPDWMFIWAVKNLKPEQIITTSHTGYLAYHGLSNMDSLRRFSRHGHSMHVDGTLTGKYLREHCLLQPNCNWVDNQMTSITRNEQGMITALNMIDGTTVEGDLFIDCTGFSRTLIKEMGAKWISYKPWLPVDRGMPFLENYAEGEVPEAWTTAWAQKNGWMWTTPLMDRKGNGYVYSSEFITDQQAQDEIEQKLGRNITPVKVIKFDAGRQDNTWIQNCVSIGLSSSFLEPLEATSIHTSICQIKMLFEEYLGDTIEQTLNPSTISMYNRRWSNQLDDLKDFLVMHYQGGRTDSEFWRYISSGATRTEFVQEILTMSKDRFPSYNDFSRYWGVAGWSLYGWVMAGLGLFNSTPSKTTAEQEHNAMMAYKGLQQEMNRLYGQNLSHQGYIKWFRMQRKARLNQNSTLKSESKDLILQR